MAEVLRAEELAQNRDLRNPRHLAHNLGGAVVQQAGDDEALAILDLHLGLGTARGEGRNGKAGDGDSVAVVQCADLGRELDADGSVGIDRRGEFDLDAEGTKLDGDRCRVPCTALNDGKRKFAAGEKARRQTTERGQCRLGQDLKDLLLLQVLHGDPDVQFGVVHKNVERIANRQRRTAAGGSAAELLG